MNSISQKANLWLTDFFDEDTKKEVLRLKNLDPCELEDSFYKDLEFGTGGMRGIMGVGTNRLNKYTIGQVTQGLAKYLKIAFQDLEKIKVAIAYDVRHNSKEFAQIVADVLSGNGIYVKLFNEHRPTPELSFSVRNLGCQAGVVLTASHNPPEYNGYKVYWEDGAQIVPPNDKALLKEIQNTNLQEVIFQGDASKIEMVGEEQDDRYINACIENSLYQKNTQDFYKNLGIVFTALHGTTYTTIPKALKRAGFEDIYFVKEQMLPSGNFPTVESPNPEEPKAFEWALRESEITNADIAIACDPDGDRLGIAVRDLSGKMILLNGNQTNTILTYYILSQWNILGKITGNEFIGSTIVTSDIFYDLAKKFGVECKVGLTGFKWIGKMIADAQGKQKFICGGEESFGFMTGDFVRDKDSCGSILLACEIAAWCKSRGSSIYEYLLEIYKEVGCYQETLVNLVKKGRTGAEEILQMMLSYRENPPKELAGSQVIKISDFLTGKTIDKENSKIEEILGIPNSNVLVFYTQNGTKVCVRPSGTEPKIKFYISQKTELKEISDYPAKIRELENNLPEILKDLGVVNH